MTTPTDRIEPHHANEAMRCAFDGEPWPCAAFVAARRRKPFGPLVIPVAKKGRVA